MILITTETQKKIIEASFQVAKEHPNQQITIKMICEKVGMSRENFYRYHFHDFNEILEKIHFLANDEINQLFVKFINSENPDILDFLRQSMIPFLYDKKEWLKILFETKLDLEWMKFLHKEYTPLVQSYLDNIEKKGPIPNLYLAQIIVKEFFAIISTWLTDNSPEPPELFMEKFLYIVEQSPAALMTNKNAN